MQEQSTKKGQIPQVSARHKGDSPADSRPPLFKRWRSWYLLVLAVLAVLILLFYLFTNHYD